MNSNARIFNLTTTDGRTSRIRLADAPLGSGGDAAIYPIPDDPGQVAKIYHDPGKDPRRRDKIRTMLSAPPDLPPIRQNGATYIQIAWPTGIIEDSRTGLAGYTMPFVDLARSTVLDNLLSRKIRRAMRLPDFYGLRVVAASNLAALVAALHARGHHIIDLKPVNLNVYLDTFFTALLDCDGLSIRGAGGKRFTAHQYTDGYIAPEALKQRLLPKDLGENQDRFALAVVLFQLLNRGIHPYQGVPRNGATLPTDNSGRIRQNLYAYGRTPNRLQSPSPWSIHRYLEDETRNLFDRAFGRDPRQRPSAAQWTEHLRELADPQTSTLKRCPRNPHHGCFSKGCGFCAIETATLRVRKKQHFQRKAANVAAPVQPRQPRTRAATPRTVAGRRRVARAAPVRRPRGSSSRIKIVACFLTGFLVLLYFGYQRWNIHSVIRRCDQETFFQYARNGSINWKKLSFEDARNAVHCPDEGVFCDIIEHLDDESVYFERDILEELVTKNREKSAVLYIDKMSASFGSESNFDMVTFMLKAKSDKIRQAYGRKLKRMNPKMDYQAFQFLFRAGRPEEIKEILAWGADPNLKMQVSNGDTLILEALFKQRAYTANFHGFTTDSKDSETLRSVLSRYNMPFKNPGLGIVQAIKRENNGLKAMVRRETFFNSGRQRSLSDSAYRLTYSIKPLTVAAIREDLQTIAALAAAGADVDKGLQSAKAAAPTIAVYRALKQAGKPADPILAAIYQDDPDQMEKRLKAADNQMATKDLLARAERMGSLRVVDALIHRYKAKLDKKIPAPSSGPTNRKILCFWLTILKAV